MNAAKQMQREREEANLKNHQERIEWLSESAPRWADGVLVDCHIRNVLLLQSREALRSA